MLLAIDTSAGTSVAVVDRDGGVLSEYSDPDRTNSAEVIGPLITEALSASNTDPSTLSGVALGMGPGEYAALVTGIGAARGFAAALGKPVVRVLSHDAVALDRQRPTLVVSAVGDGSLICTAYGEPDAELGLPSRIFEPRLLAAADITTVEDYARYDRADVTQISAGALGMLAERLFAGRRSFARKEPYSFREPPLER